MAIRDERPPILGFDELLDRATQAEYPSGTRLGQHLARAAVAGTITAEQINEVNAAARARRAELMATDGEPTLDEAGAVDAAPTVPAASGQKPWSPTDVLDRLSPDSRRADYAERQLPVGDREEHIDYGNQ